MKRIAILGVSGSIGKQSVDVIKQHQDLYSLVAASVNTSIKYLEELVKDFPSLKHICIGDYELYKEFSNKYQDINVYYGDEGLVKIATLEEVDYVINSVVGFKGLIPTLEAITLTVNGLSPDITLQATLFSLKYFIVSKASFLI